MMVKGLEALNSRPYPGRLIIIGKDLSGEHVVVLYAITGRSPSSQARQIVFKDNSAWVKLVDDSLVKTGDVNLLVYPAIFISHAVAVSNGRQTDDIRSRLHLSNKPGEVLMQALHKWSYEPDVPTFTPRISGCVLASDSAALSILKREEDGSCLRNFFEFHLIPGQGKMIATYAGANQDPLPSFMGEPVDVGIHTHTVQGTAEQVYSALKPEIPGKDLRVAVACVFAQDLESGVYSTAVINRHERKK